MSTLETRDPQLSKTSRASVSSFLMDGELTPQGGVPVSVVIRRQVRPEHISDYEAWLKKIVAKSMTFAGYLGTHIVKPSDKSTDNTWQIIYRFDTVEHLKGWHDSPDRHQLLDELDESGILDRDDMVSVQEGWVSFFQESDLEEEQPAEQTKKPKPPRPAKYRLVVIVMFCVWVVVTLLNLPGSLAPTLSDALDVQSNPRYIPLIILCVVATAVPVVLLCMVPVLSRLLKGWLTRPVPPKPKNRALRKLYHVVIV